jgi:serine protein kinase
MLKTGGVMVDRPKVPGNDLMQVSRKEAWQGTCFDYLKLVQENPDIAQTAPGRVYNVIMTKGTAPMDDALRGPNHEDLVSYPFFQDELFGMEEPLHDIIRFFKAGARRTETGKRILMLIGPASSGKSTVARLIKAGLERDGTPIYAIKDCPIHEEPLHLIPRAQRPRWEKELGVRIEGDLCPVCRCRLVEGDRYRDKDGHVLWERFPVIRIRLSEKGRVGIGTFQGRDAKGHDISELIGRVHLTTIVKCGETDPAAYHLDGELEAANRGFMEYHDILKCDTEFHHVLLSIAQEQALKAPHFPQIYVDEVIFSHTDAREFERFKSLKENEALHDRMYPIFVPYVLRFREEEKIYKKLIERGEFRNVPVSPGTLTAAAQFAVLTRLAESAACPSVFRKMTVYNSEGSRDRDATPEEIARLRAEGKGKGEGMSGISPRFVMNALSRLFREKEAGGAVNALDVIHVLRSSVENETAFTLEERGRYLTLLTGEGGRVLAGYENSAENDG